MVLLFCLGLLSSRAPLSFDEFADVLEGNEHGIAFAYDCSCYTPVLDCESHGDDGIQTSIPWCACTYFGTNPCTPSGGGDPGGGSGGSGGSGGGGGAGSLTPEQIRALANVLAELQNANNAAGGAANNLAALTSLYNSLTVLHYFFNDALSHVSSAINTINRSLILVADYLEKGKGLGPEALEMVERQIVIAALQRGLCRGQKRRNARH